MTSDSLQYHSRITLLRFKNLKQPVKIHFSNRKNFVHFELISVLFNIYLSKKEILAILMSVKSCKEISKCLRLCFVHFGHVLRNNPLTVSFSSVQLLNVER